jgi:hypothetical protein
MNTRQIIERLLIGLIFLVLMMVMWVITPQTAAAQCGDNPPHSSCYTCHEKTYPVIGKGEWHEDHARMDYCWNCHGGNTQTMDKEQAHQGMTLQPLGDIYTDCFACHPSDYQARAERFGAVLGVMPAGQEPTPESSISSAPDKNLQLIILPTPEPVSAPATLWDPELVCISLGFAALITFLLWNKFRQRNSSLAS